MALMLMRSVFSGWRHSEAYHLCLNNNVDGLAVSGQETLVADKDEIRTQVLGKPIRESGDCNVISFKREQEAISPKATICTLLPGQYLPCGLGPWKHLYTLFNLTSVDIRRWELCASAIREIMKTTSTIYEYNLAGTVEINSIPQFLREQKLDETLAVHIPNFRTDDIEQYLAVWDPSLLRETGYLLLYLLRFFVPLTAAYGGIHLSAWNFGFPSRVESVIWRTACFIIMGSSFALLTIPSWEALDDYFDRFDPRSIHRKKRRALKLLGFNFMKALINTAAFGFGGLLLLCYAASRIYLVVESFISLRHVPIGVYAAVPWVQNIPHV